ncbi:MAG: response regulator [Candidatus Anammoxibacter sp.]
MSKHKKHKPLILVVDDQLLICKMITSVLNVSYETVVKTSGREAIEFMENDEPDLVLLDIEMPEIDGYAVCDWIRNKPRFDDTSVIFISGQESKDGKVKAFKVGGVDYLTKPFESEELMARVQTHLSLQNMKKELKRKNCILECKIVEINEKSEQLREKDLLLLGMDRIAGIAILGAGIAHEINNPLSFVKSAICFVEKSMNKMTKVVKYWDDKPLPEELLSDYKEFLSMLNFDLLTSTLDERFSRINKGIERIMFIVKNLKSFSRVDRGDVSMIDVNQSIRETLELLRIEELKNVNFVSELEEVPAFECLATEINQCLLYTIQNAIYAVDNNGIIRVSSSYNEDNKHVIIKIADNGNGMSQDELRNAMDPFFTTKPVGTGTGLGLTLTERIIVRHKGQINIASKEGIGTTVTLTLPVDNKIVG